MVLPITMDQVNFFKALPEASYYRNDPNKYLSL